MYGWVPKFVWLLALRGTRVNRIASSVSDACKQEQGRHVAHRSEVKITWDEMKHAALSKLLSSSRDSYDLWT